MNLTSKLTQLVIDCIELFVDSRTGRELWTNTWFSCTELTSSCRVRRNLYSFSANGHSDLEGELVNLASVLCYLTRTDREPLQHGPVR